MICCIDFQAQLAWLLRFETVSKQMSATIGS